jgi:hypothetical protein
VEFEDGLSTSVLKNKATCNKNFRKASKKVSCFQTPSISPLTIKFIGGKIIGQALKWCNAL